MQRLGRETIDLFRTEGGPRCGRDAEHRVVGGSALMLLGGRRPAIDADDVGSDTIETGRQRTLEPIPSQMSLLVDAVPPEGVPPTAGHVRDRRRFVGLDGFLDLHMFAPHTIAGSKIDPRFDVQIEDVVFPVASSLVNPEQL